MEFSSIHDPDDRRRDSVLRPRDHQVHQDKWVLLPQKDVIKGVRNGSERAETWAKPRIRSPNQSSSHDWAWLGH